jgi:hypothetical protein
MEPPDAHEPIYIFEWSVLSYAFLRPPRRAPWPLGATARVAFCSQDAGAGKPCGRGGGGARKGAMTGGEGKANGER